MFGFSLTKILLLAAVIVVVWQVFKQIQRRTEVGERRRAGKVREARRETQGSADPVEDMVRCKVCDSFVAGAAARSCGRTDCPYPA